MATSTSPGGAATGRAGYDEASHPLGAVRTQRAGLHDALMALEEAVAAPVPGRVGEWGRNVHAALVMLTAAYERHLAVTEGAEGLFAEIMATAPHCAQAVAHVRAEHQAITERLAAVTSHARTLDPVQLAAGRLREEAVGLLTAFVRHRQKGADLVYDAFATDIGGSE